MTDRFEAEGVTLYLGDCRDILPTLAGIHAVITDPPYGMKWDADTTRFSGGSPDSVKRRGKGNEGKPIEGDNELFDPSPWLEFPRVVLFGSNHFGSRLPVGTKLIWLKRSDYAFGTFLSDAEEAWMKGGHGVYCKRVLSPTDKAVNGRSHPTQKPVALMAWCMDKAKVPKGATVLDPYMGSGTTGIACIRTGRKFIGIEIDPDHFATSVERIKRELQQGRLAL